MRKSCGSSFFGDFPQHRKPFLRTLAACLLLGFRAHAWEKEPCEIPIAAAGGAFTLARRPIIAGRSLIRSERRFGATPLRSRPPRRKKGCQNGELGKAALAVLRSLLFDFTNMKTGVCFPRVRTLQEKLQPWYSRASIFRALEKLEAAGVLVRVHRRMRNAGKLFKAPACMFSLRSRKPRRLWRRRPAISPRLRPARSGRHFGLDQSLRARAFLRRTCFLGLKNGENLLLSPQPLIGQASVCR